MRGKAGYSDPDPQILMTSEKGGGGGRVKKNTFQGVEQEEPLTEPQAPAPTPPPPHPNFFGMEA